MARTQLGPAAAVQRAADKTLRHRRQRFPPRAGEPDVELFAYADLEGDRSLDILTPKEKERAADALALPQNKIRLRAVRDVAALMELAFPDEEIALASLRRGFFVRAQDCNGAVDASLIAALMERLDPMLPADVRARGPEEFIANYEQLVRAYAQAMNATSRLFSR